MNLAANEIFSPPLFYRSFCEMINNKNDLIMQTEIIIIKWSKIFRICKILFWKLRLGINWEYYLVYKHSKNIRWCFRDDVMHLIQSLITVDYL